MSLRAQLAMWHLKLTVRSRPLHETPPETLRAIAEKYTAMKTLPEGASVAAVEGARVRGEWHRHETSHDERTIFYCHGGGYVFGSPKTHRAATLALAQMACARVFSLDYRLAPEHPFPAALDDALAAWRWLLEEGSDPSRTVICGDSAGGGLALGLIHALKSRGLPLPAAIATFSPWTDLSVSGKSVTENATTDAMFKPVYIKESAKKVLNGRDPRAPLASPIFADVAGYPPTIIFVAEEEMLRDDGVRMYERLSAAGVETEIVRASGVPHAWPVFYRSFPEAGEALLRAVDFLSAHAGWGGNSGVGDDDV